MIPVGSEIVRVEDAFWTRYMDLVRDVMIPYQWEVMNDRVDGVEKSHAIANFRIASGLEIGEFYGYRFQDSDVYKWLEAVAYSLSRTPDPKLEALADEAIALVGAAQEPDGYLNTYFTIKEPAKRWKNERDSHELYVAGHMFEAAAAYFRATGKRVFLDIARRNADHVDSVFGREPGKKRGYP
ncbi:MAG: glycoside hydrolase family 127 protein, partial [Spirochaetaceae bacterium]|nr:glycoside hydrolase family 127 protein [Spirochaetaceae bacterium]